MTAAQLRLRELRARHRWSVRELARRAGVRPATVTALELGHHSPKLETLEKLAKALRVPVARLLP